MQHLAVGKMHW